MEAGEVIEHLRRCGRAGTARILARHGVKDETFGVSYAQIGKLTKQLGVDHELAQMLWRSKIHEARIVAMRIADPHRATRAALRQWLKACQDPVLTDAVAGLAARTPHARELALEWIASDDEWVGAGGWSVISQLAITGRVPTGTARRLIRTIRAQIHGQKNRTRHSMNGALIALGGSDPAVRELAIEAAEAIGPVAVDHGETACKTPDAAAYIKRMVEPSAARPSRKNGSAASPKQHTTRRRP
jgi:3-methyladenine DNA glycosylase AlkD